MTALDQERNLFWIRLVLVSDLFLMSMTVEWHAFQCCFGKTTALLGCTKPLSETKSKLPSGCYWFDSSSLKNYTNWAVLFITVHWAFPARNKHLPFWGWSKWPAKLRFVSSIFDTFFQEMTLFPSDRPCRFWKTHSPNSEENHIFE